MKICYIAPVKTNNNVVLYSSSLPILIAPAIIVLNNILKTAINIGWALLIISIIQTLLKFAKSRDMNELVCEMKKLAVAAVLMWAIPYVPEFIDVIVSSLGETAINSVSTSF